MILDRVSRAGLARPAFAMGVVGFIVSVVAVVLISGNPEQPSLFSYTFGSAMWRQSSHRLTLPRRRKRDASCACGVQSHLGETLELPNTTRRQLDIRAADDRDSRPFGQDNLAWQRGFGHTRRGVDR